LMRADSSSSSSSSFSPVPLSLSSWLHMRCSFTARTQLDELVVPWVERWSAQAPDEADVAVDPLAHSLWSLQHQQTQSAARFDDYLQQQQRGLALPVHAPPAVSELQLHDAPMDGQQQRPEHEAREGAEAEEEEEEEDAEAAEGEQEEAEESTSPPPSDQEEEEADASHSHSSDLSGVVEVSSLPLSSSVPTLLAAGLVDSASEAVSEDDDGVDCDVDDAASPLAVAARSMLPPHDGDDENDKATADGATAAAAAPAALSHPSSAHDLRVDEQHEEQTDAPSDSSHPPPPPRLNSTTWLNGGPISTLPAVLAVAPAAAAADDTPTTFH
jgi:hypothetical protein